MYDSMAPRRSHLLGFLTCTAYHLPIKDIQYTVVSSQDSLILGSTFQSFPPNVAKHTLKRPMPRHNHHLRTWRLSMDRVFPHGETKTDKIEKPTGGPCKYFKKKYSNRKDGTRVNITERKRAPYICGHSTTSPSPCLRNSGIITKCSTRIDTPRPYKLRLTTGFKSPREPSDVLFSGF